MPAALNESAITLAKRAWQSILFPHDYRPGPNASLAIGAALRLLGRSQGAGASWAGSDKDREAEVAELREAQVEFDFTQGHDPAGGGGEHLTYFAKERDGLIYKATWREQFGFVPKLNDRGKLVLCVASPSEYLLRCGLANVAFGDDIRLLCVAQDQAGGSEFPSIITSQPFIVGEPPDARAIAKHLRALEFRPLPKADHRPSGLHDVWYRRADQVVICDAVAGNFVRTMAGDIVAIDLPAALAADIL